MNDPNDLDRPYEKNQGNMDKEATDREIRLDSRTLLQADATAIVGALFFLPLVLLYPHITSYMPGHSLEY